MTPHDCRTGPFAYSAELLFFGGTGQCGNRRGATLDNGGHVIEIASTDFLLMRHKGVTPLARSEFRLLNHLGVVLHAFAACVCVSELEGVVPIDMDTGERDELVLVAQIRQLFLERSDLGVRQVLFPVE